MSVPESILETALLAEAPKQWTHFQARKAKMGRGKSKWQRELDGIDNRLADAKAHAEKLRRQYDPELMRIANNLDRKTGAPAGALRCPKCVAPNTYVYRNPSIMPIEQIESGGDIQETFKQNYSGQIVTIKARYLDSVSFSPDHEIMVLRRPHNCLGLPEGPMWIKASEIIRARDMVIMPDPAKQGEDVWLDFRRYFNSIGKVPKMLLDPVLLDEELAELFGWYLAEGCAVKNKAVLFCLGRHEPENIERVSYLIRQKLGYGSKAKPVKKWPNSIVIEMYSRTLACFFKDSFGGNALSKHVPEFIFRAKNNIIKSFLDAYIKGDGWRNNDKGLISISSVSERVIKEVQYLFFRLGIVGGYNKSMAPTQPHTYMGRIIRGNPQHCLKIALKRKRDIKRHYVKLFNHYCFPVDEKKIEEYSGSLHNLRMEEGTYQVPFIIHNCGEPDRQNKMNGKAWCLKDNIPLIPKNKIGKWVDFPQIKRASEPRHPTFVGDE